MEKVPANEKVLENEKDFRLLKEERGSNVG